MVKIKKKESTTAIYKSLNGENLKINLQKSGACLKVSIQNVSSDYLLKELCIVPSLGVQITVTFAMGSKTQFIPQEHVEQLFLNEVIFRHKVIYVMNLLVQNIDGKDDNVERVVPLFTHTLPRLSCLKVIYNNINLIKG